MEAPPQSLQIRLCAQMLLPPQSTHSRLRRPCGHFVCGCVVLALFSLLCRLRLLPYPPCRLRLLPYPPFPACRFPLALALSALAPLLAKLLAEPRVQELFTRGLGHLQADGLADARCGGRGAMPSLGGRWSARGTSRVGGTAGLSCLSEARSRRRRRRLSTLWSRDTWP